MKRKLLSLTLIIISVVQLQAQVTIGSGEPPHTDALLELKENNMGTSSKGLLLPRVSLTSTTSFDPLSTHVEGMTVYNQATANDVTPGYYYNDGTQWLRLATGGSRFFYMPSIILPTDTDDPGYELATEIFTVDLYSKYAAQFGFSNPATTVKNPESVTTAVTLPVIGSNALNYFVIYYDDTVFESVSISDMGVLKYKLISGHVITENTFMNIVFQEK